VPEKQIEMKEQLISFNTAKLAKEKGFDIKQKNWYDQIGGLNPRRGASGAMCYENVGYAPTQSLLQKWFRELPTPIIIAVSTDFIAFEVEIKHPDIRDVKIIEVDSEEKWFNSYEDALEAGLEYALKLIK
jgi:hypothetical protein